VIFYNVTGYFQKKGRKKEKRLLALFLSVILVLSVMPMAFAAETHNCDNAEDCLVCYIAGLINSLPEAEDITVENAAEVTDTIHAIDRVKFELTDEEYEELMTLVATKESESGGIDVPKAYKEAFDAVTDLNYGGWLAVSKKVLIAGIENYDLSRSSVSFEIVGSNGYASTISLCDAVQGVFTLSEAQVQYADFDTATLASVEGYYTMEEDGWTYLYRLPAGSYTIREITDSMIVNGEEYTGFDVSCNGEDAKDGYTFTLTDGSKSIIQFSNAVNRFTLSYDANGGEGYVPETMGFGFLPVAENEFVRDGYTFTGWNTEVDGSGIAYLPGEEFDLRSGDAVLYAQWAQNSCTVTFEYANGDKVEQTYDFGAEITAPDNSEANYDETHHYVYSWPAFETVTGDVTYQEVTESQEHSFTYTYKDAETHAVACDCGYSADAEHSESTPASCTEAAYCDECKSNYGDTLAHTEEIIPEVPATCTGTGLTEGKKCSVCGEVTVKQKETGSHGYNYVGHITTPATCTEEGVMTYICTYDGNHKFEEKIETAAHDTVQVDAKAPECEEIGWEEYEYCLNCTYTTYKEIAATDHSFDIAKTEENLTRPVKNADGSWSDGYYTYTCENDASHTITEAVKRADYSEYDKLIENAETILGLDMPEEDKAKLEEVLANNDISDNLIVSEQDIIDGVLDDIRNVIIEVYLDAGLTLEIRGASELYSGTVLDLKVFKVNDIVEIEVTDVNWVSSDDDIVFFSNGKLFAIGTGTVTLTATTGLLKASITVTITEGGNPRTIRFSAIDKMHFIVEDYIAIFNGANLYWTDDYTIRFRVHTYQNFPFETYIVYINGQEIQPDADGYYTVPADTGDVSVTVSGAVYDDSTDSSGKLNFWEWLISLFEKIINFFKNFLGIA